MLKRFLLFLSIFFINLPINAQQLATEIAPSEGVSFDSIWRGVLGMIALLALAYLFSSNKKAIQWKTVFIGISIQLLIAIGVLRIPIIQSAFEGVGQIFVSVLDYTRAGSKFLFEGFFFPIENPTQCNSICNVF